MFSGYQKNSSGNREKMQLDFDPQIDYYQKLGIQHGATEGDIKKAFYELAKKYHPDSHQSKQTTFDEEKFKEISCAYDVLSDKNKKKMYD